MRRPLRTAAATIVLLFIAVPTARAQCLPLMCNFSESGKKGPFIKTRVEQAELDKAAKVIASGEVDGSLLGAGSLNRGEMSGVGISMKSTEAALKLLVDQKLRPQWPYSQPAPIHVRIIGTYQMSPQTHPDNVIVVPFGMLDRASSDDEIVWFMAHEFSHLALKHFAREAKSRKRSKSLTDVVSMLQGGVELSQSRYTFQNGKLSAQALNAAETAKLSGRIYAKSHSLQDVLRLANKFFSRRQEDQADASGFDLAFAAGYADSGAGEALAHIGEDDANRKSLLQSLGEDFGRFTQLQTGKALAGVSEGRSLRDVGNAAFGDFLENAKEIAGKKLMDSYLTSHRDPEKRRQGINNYFERAYPSGDFRRAGSVWAAKIRLSPEYKQARIAVLARAKANEALSNENNPQKAMTLLAPADATPYAGTPLILNVKAQVYRAAGRLKEAEGFYSRAAGIVSGGKARKGAVPAPAGPDGFYTQSLSDYVAHVDLLIEMSDYARADLVILRAQKAFGDDNAFLPQQIRIALARKQRETVLALLARCGQTEDEGLTEAWKTALRESKEAAAAYAVLTPLEQAEFNGKAAALMSGARSAKFWSGLSETLAIKKDDD